MRYSLMVAHCLFLVALQVLTGVALLAHQTLGVAPEPAMFYGFIGLNLPTMILSRKDRGANRGLWTGPGCAIMALIMLNFLRAAGAGDWKAWAGILHALSAQSLWIAVPSAWSLRQLRA